MVVLTAMPSTPSGVNIVAVTFLVDGVSIGSTASSPYSFQWDTTTIADGTHILTASLTDSGGKTTVSPSVSVKVMNNQALTVGLSASQVVPIPGSTGTGVTTGTGTGTTTGTGTGTTTGTGTGTTTGTGTGTTTVTTTASTASGFATLIVNVVTGVASGNVVVTGTTATSAAIFQGFAGQTGNALIMLQPNAANPKQWDVPAGTVLTPAQLVMLLQGSMYIQVASAAFPAGEIRGQILPPGVMVVRSPMSGLQEVPIVGTVATGTISTTVDMLANNVTVFVNTTGVTGVTTAQVSTGAQGMVGTELVALTLGTMNGTVFNPNQFSIQMFQVAATDVANFMNSMWYVNVTTATNPVGLIRGQIIPAPTLSQIQTAIFTPICSSCHTGVGTALPGALNLTSAAASYKALVGQFTVEQPTVEFVSPGNPATSYLVQKLQGAVTISGKQMPLGGPYLSTAQIAMIQQWIAAGPQNN